MNEDDCYDVIDCMQFDNDVKFFGNEDLVEIEFGDEQEDCFMLEHCTIVQKWVVDGKQYC